MQKIGGGLNAKEDEKNAENDKMGEFFSTVKRDEG